MDHIDTAIHSTVHDSELAAKQIAATVGISYQVLLNKANPQCEANKLSVHEAVAIMKATGSTRIIEAMALEVGAQVLTAAPKNYGCILSTVLVAGREHGDVMRAIESSLSDRHFSLREREVCHREINEAIEALMSLRQAVADHP